METSTIKPVTFLDGYTYRPKTTKPSNTQPKEGNK